MRTILQGGLLDHRPGSGSFSDSGDAPSQGDREAPQARCIRAEVQGAHHPAPPTHLGPMMVLPDSVQPSSALSASGQQGRGGLSGKAVMYNFSPSVRSGKNGPGPGTPPY